MEDKVRELREQLRAKAKELHAVARNFHSSVESLRELGAEVGNITTLCARLDVRIGEWLGSQEEEDEPE